MKEIIAMVSMKTIDVYTFKFNKYRLSYKVTCLFNKLVSISILFLFCSGLSVAQINKRVNVWYFGYNAGLNFNNGNPIPLTNGNLSIWEGCATICDENGNLLFYTDGRNIWNKNHGIMPNATNLGGDNSSSQSGIIVPAPENPDIYYVFSVDAEGGSGGVQYAIVDMTLNGGRGGIISKNNRLLSRAAEKLTVVRHCNNKDFWVLTHELNSNTFRAFLITKDGLAGTSVESKAGSIHYGGTGAIGYMKASPNGQKIAICTWQGNIELLDFDNSSGKLSNARSFNNSSIRYAYGAEFSPNNEFLYISIAESQIILQFEVNVNNSTEFIASKVEIINTNAFSNSKIGALQLGPNDKIYVAIDNYGYLGVIANPNSKGLNAHFIFDGIYLAGKRSGLGLPNLITSYFNVVPAVTVNVSRGINCNDIILTANSTSNAPNLTFQWFLDNKPINNSNQSIFSPTKSGSYNLSIKEAGKCVNDSAKSMPLNIFILEANPQIVTKYCGGVKLQANANSFFKWIGNGIASDKANQDTLTVYGTGTQVFKVQVFNENDITCFIEKEISVNFTEAPVYSFGKSNIFACDTITLEAPANTFWDSYSWNSSDGTIVNSNKILIKKTGEYTITAKTSDSNCEAKDIVSVVIGISPIIKSDEIVCIETESITLEAGASGNISSYEWLPGNIKSASLVVNTEGVYQVKVTSPDGCLKTRNIQVEGFCNTRIFAPDIFTPNNDGHNDFLEVFIIGGKNTKLDIYDRWGNHLFSKDNPKLIWDGVFKGNLCPNGTYIYTVTYQSIKDNSTNKYYGAVLLQR